MRVRRPGERLDEIRYLAVLLRVLLLLLLLPPLLTLLLLPAAS